MDIRATRTCEKCKSSVPLGQVRLLPKPDGSNALLCIACTEEVKKAKIPVSKAKRLPPPEYETYFCQRCKYTFRADKHKIDVTYSLHCPYCGKSDRLHKK